MAQFTPSDLWSLAFASFLLAIYGATLVYRGWRNVRVHGCFATCSGIFSWCSSLGRRALLAVRRKASEKDNDPVAQYIAKQIEDRVVADLRLILFYGVPLLAANLAVIVLNIIAGGKRANSQGDDILTFLSFAIFMPLRQCPSALSTRTAPLFYMAVMSLVTLFLLTAKTPTALFYRTACHWVWRHLCSVAFQNPRIAAGCQLVYLLLAVLRFSQVSANGESDITASQHFIFELCVMIIIVAYTCQAASSTHYKVSQEVSSSMLKDERSAMSAMLDLLCDVVVELGPDLRLHKGASRFAALMTLDKMGSPEASSTIQDFMPLRDDKQNFESCLASATDADGGPSDAYPGVLHVKLRDAIGNLIRVELFYVRFRHLDKFGFLVGLREEADTSTLPIPELPSLDPDSTRKKKDKKRGTPPTKLGQTLVSSDEEDAKSTVSSASSNCSGKKAKRHPTSVNGRILSLTNGMQTWVLEEGVQACCPWHAAMAAVEAPISKMKEFRCAMEFPRTQEYEHQCKNCGNLVASPCHRRNQRIIPNLKLTCSLCGHERMRSISLKRETQEEQTSLFAL